MIKFTCAVLWHGMPYNKFIIDQASSVKMLDIGLRLSFHPWTLTWPQSFAQQDLLHVLKELCSALCNLLR